MQNEAEFKLLLKTAIVAPSRPIVFLAGAGISVGSGLPNFRTFSKHIIRCATGCLEREGHVRRASVISEEEVGRLAAQLRPEVLLQALSEEFREDLFEFYEWLVGALPSPNHEFLARAVRAGHCVFTTNVDCLIESAYHDLYGEEPRACVEPEQFAAFLSSESCDGEQMFRPGWLLKLHGSLDLQSTDKKRRYGSIQFALNQVGQGLMPEKAEALRRCFANTDSCFVGYSGCDHFSVQPILRNTPSRRALFWLWFDKTTEARWEPAAEAFSRMQEVVGEIARGASYADIDQDGRRGWEKLSVGEILCGAERGDTSLRVGNTSELLWQVVREIRGADIPRASIPEKAAPVPDWLAATLPVQHHLAAARLLRRAGELDAAEQHCKEALAIAATERERADAFSVLGDVLLVPSLLDTDRQARQALEAALVGYESLQLAEQIVETRLEIANVVRRMKEYQEAMSILDETEKRLADVQLEGTRTRLEVRLELLYGLILGLSGHATVSNSDMAIQRLTRAVEHAHAAGLVATESSALNSRGLVGYQIARDSKEKLTQAEADLTRALESTRVCWRHRRTWRRFANTQCRCEMQS